MRPESAPRWERSNCPYCGVGCGLKVGVADGALVKMKGDPDHPANFGEICAKAAHLVPTTTVDGRLLHPHIRERRDGALKPVSWHRALAYAAARLREIIASYGPDSVAFYGSGQLTTEDYYVFNKLVKGFLVAPRSIVEIQRHCLEGRSRQGLICNCLAGRISSGEDVNLREFKRSGHWPSLLCAFLYFDSSFAIWTLIGALGVFIAQTFHLSPAQKGFLVAVPLLGGAVLRIVLGIASDHFGPRKVGIAGMMVTFVPLIWALSLFFVAFSVVGSRALPWP
jgi:Molybdopterin oxidoreductase Fe4S4 domain/Molybdopterin oxidoreductase/Major Facilitator Superfamily